MTEHLSLAQLRTRFVEQNEALTKEWEERLRADPRSGAAAILRAVDKRRQQNRAEGQRLRKMLMHERAWWKQGHDYIAGVDEAGMSPLAGPIVACLGLFCAPVNPLSHGVVFGGLHNTHRVMLQSHWRPVQMVCYQ